MGFDGVLTKHVSVPSHTTRSRLQSFKFPPSISLLISYSTSELDAAFQRTVLFMQTISPGIAIGRKPGIPKCIPTPCAEMPN